MQEPVTYTLTNPQNGNLAFKIFSFENGGLFDHVQRNNYFSLIWVQHGHGKVKADFTDYEIVDNRLFAFTPYQPFMFNAGEVKGLVINFHPDFFCIHKHHPEVACNGVLFNNIYQPPYITINDATAVVLDGLIREMKAAILDDSLAQYDLLISYLKIFLITCSRLKTEQQPEAADSLRHDKAPFILQHLKETIEKDFKSKHSAGDYANALNISTKALGKITKTHLNKTITALISERIVIEAKRELYLTNKSVKEIAYELGYDDEYYFSRFFKNNTDVSPQFYRETVGFGKATA